MQREAIRLIVVFVLGLLAASLLSEAQQQRPAPRVGILSAGSLTPERTRNFDAFRHRLRDLGWMEGQNILVEYRFAGDSPERLPDLAAELVQLPVDVLVCLGGSAVIRAAQHATSAIPIVMVTTTDPLAQGFIASYARPGGNITGVGSLYLQISGKRLQLLREAVPALTRLGVLMNPDQPTAAAMLRETQAAAQALGVRVYVGEVRRPDEIERAFATLRAAGAEALFVLIDASVLERHLQAVIALALQSRLPAMYPWRMYVDAGGLMAYAPSLASLYQHAATYVDRLLKGANPADLPVEQPTQFELVVNLKTAQALGLTISPTVLFQADEVIK
jgi:putative tryptophan/tyrosine transport system substrate-binding protein